VVVALDYDRLSSRQWVRIGGDIWEIEWSHSQQAMARLKCRDPGNAHGLLESSPGRHGYAMGVFG